jgi:predicted nucleic acid-binding protein
MTPAFIVDCSLAMTWVFQDEATAESTDLLRRLATESALVPSHWFLEVSNVLATAERRNRISVTETAQFLAMLDTLQVEIDNDTLARAFDHILPLARTHSLTTYDAAYLDLALRRQLPLASLDSDLRQAATKFGVQLLGL